VLRTMAHSSWRRRVQVVCSRLADVQYATPRVGVTATNLTVVGTSLAPWYVATVGPLWQTLRSLILHHQFPFTGSENQRTNRGTSERLIRCRHSGPCCCTCKRCEEESTKHCSGNVWPRGGPQSNVVNSVYWFA
jgi:hypothetical protein